MTKQRQIIILEELPPAPPRHKETWVIFTALSFIFCFAIFYGQIALLGMGISLEGLAALYAIIQPFFGPFFHFLKISSSSALMFFPLVIFTLLQIISFRFIIPALQEKMQTLTALERALGPVTKPVHRMWFAIAAITGLCAIALTTLPSWTNESVALTVFYSLLRIGLFTTCAAATVGTALIGARLRYSWQKFKRFGAGRQTTAASNTLEIQSKSISDTVAGDTTPQSDQQKLAAATNDESVFIALAAELVESAGRTRQLPNYRQLEMPLLELQQAAAATHSGQFEHANLRGLCEQACELLAAGKLNSLPDLNAARTAYQKHDPSLYIDLATELRQKIKT